MNLNYSYYEADNHGVYGHAQLNMKQLGVQYQMATPQSLYDGFWFWNCSNVPQPLPPYLTPLKISAQQAVGHGLSQEDADAIDERSRALQGGEELSSIVGELLSRNKGTPS